MRHEVTAAHTRSLFCSLQLFFLPLALRVAIPIVHKNSWCVAAQQESHTVFSFPLLSESLHPNARLGGAETSSARLAAVRKPQPLTPKLRVPLLGDTARQLPQTTWSPGTFPRPPTPSVSLVSTAHFAGRVRSSPFAPPRDRRLPNPWRVGPVRRGCTRSCSWNFSRLLLHSEPQPLRWTALLFPGSGGGSGLLPVTVDLLTLSVTFQINGTKKLQRAAEQKSETKERRWEGRSACWQLRNIGSSLERVLSPATVGEAARLLGSHSYDVTSREGTQSPGLKTRRCFQSETQADGSLFPLGAGEVPRGKVWPLIFPLAACPISFIEHRLLQASEHSSQVKVKYAGVSLLLICLIVSISIFGVKKQVGGFLALYFSFFLFSNC